MIPIGSGAATGVPSLPATPVVADATPSGPSPASERELRDKLMATEPTRMSPRTELAARQLGESEIPGIRVVTEGPSEIMIRDLVQYEVRIENRGAKEAQGLVVRSSLPPWAEIQGQSASFGNVKLVLIRTVTHNCSGTSTSCPLGWSNGCLFGSVPLARGQFEVATDWTVLSQRHVASVQVREPN